MVHAKERALYSTQERAYGAAIAHAEANNFLAYHTEARPVVKRGQCLGYEAWYRDNNSNYHPVYEVYHALCRISISRVH